MTISVDVLEKYPDEQFPFTVDFTPVLDVTIISTVVVTSAKVGVDTTASIILSQSNTDTVVTVTVQAGEVLEVHNILIKVTALDGSIYEKVVNLYVVAPE